MTMTSGICDCCNREAVLAGVASSSLGPMSLAYCKDCLVNRAEPLYLVEGMIEINGASTWYLDTTVFYRDTYVPYAIVLVNKKQRRIFLLHGWGRYLCRQADLRRDMDYIIKQRAYDGTEPRSSGRWRISVAEDEWAGLYQRIDFRIQRAQRAFRMDGCIAEHVFGDQGWVKTPDEVIKQRNTDYFQEQYRQRAHDAKKRFPRDIHEKIDEAANEETMREIY